MSTQPQRDIIRDGFKDMNTQSDAGNVSSAGRATEFTDKRLLTQPTEQERALAFAENIFDLFRAMTHLPNAE